MARMILLSILIAVVCTGLASCGGGRAAAPDGGGIAEVSQPVAGDSLVAVPFPVGAALLPEDVPRAASSTDVQTLHGSERYSKSANATDNGNFLDLGAGAGEISWGMYRFTDLVDEDIPQSLDIEFTEPLPDTYYLGLADFASRKWQWHELGSGHTTSTSEHDVFGLPAGPDYISANGYVFAVVLVFDGVSDVIYSVELTSEINDEAPFAECFATPNRGNAALSVDFDATTSFDKAGGGIESYRWDWEGDGTVDVIGLLSTYTHIYAQRGEYSPIVTVVDTDGLMDTVQLGVVVSGWIHSWGTSNDDVINALTRDDAGDVYAVGSCDGGFALNDSLLITKFDRFGEPLWAKKWDSPEDDTLQAVWKLADGSLLAAGTTYGAGAGNGDVLLLNFSPDGEALGAWTWGETGLDTCRDMQVDGSGNIYLCGSTSSFGEVNGPNVLTLKLNSSINLEWARSWGPNYPDYGRKIRLDLQSNPYVLVDSESFNQPRSEIVLLKYDPDGALTWSKRFYMTSHVNGIGMDLDWLGNAYIVGTDDSSPEKLLLLRFDSSGALPLQKTWDAGYRAAGWDIVVTGSMWLPTTLRIIGDTYGASSDKDILYLKLSSSGVPSIEKSLVAPGFQDGYCLTLGKSGELLMGGWTQDNSGVWLDTPGTVADAGGWALVNAVAGTASISGIEPVALDVVLVDAAGTLDTGAGGIWDAVAMAYFEDDL